MKSDHLHRVDYVVVDCGIAGLRAAIELGQAGSVLVLAKSELGDSATAWAQGGIAAALSDKDEITLHAQDTLHAGRWGSSSRARRLPARKAAAATTAPTSPSTTTRSFRNTPSFPAEKEPTVNSNFSSTMDD